MRDKIGVDYSIFFENASTVLEYSDIEWIKNPREKKILYFQHCRTVEDLPKFY